MDCKKQYSSKAALRKFIAQKEPSLLKKISAGKNRSNKWSNEWATVDINKIVEKFAPGSNAEVEGAKIYFRGDDYDVVADVGGGYLRIYNKKIDAYVDQDGNDVRNEVVNGKIRGRNKKEQLKLTHFCIKKEES